GRRFLIERGIAADKLAAMGFSKGGAAVLLASDKTFFSERKERFAAAMAFYPSCFLRARQPRPATPVFMALGEGDDWTGVRPCEELARAYRTAGGDITVRIYADAGHGFDGGTSRQFPTAENFMDCIAFLEPDGSYSYNDAPYAAGDRSIYAAMRR